MVATLETTLHEFRQSLPDEEQKEFQLDTFDTLNQTLFQLQRDQEMQKSMMDLNRLNEFITRMRVITNAFEAHGSLGLRALVWGPVRLILHVCLQSISSFIPP